MCPPFRVASTKPPRLTPPTHRHPIDQWLQNKTRKKTKKESKDIIFGHNNPLKLYFQGWCSTWEEGGRRKSGADRALSGSGNNAPTE
ncbi:hypothetical protein VTH06DRAFT_8341 [Thermothelomyces fergusii]